MAASALTSTVMVTVTMLFKAGSPWSVAVIFSSILPSTLGGKASLSSTPLLVSTPVAGLMVKLPLYSLGTMAKTIFEFCVSGSSASVACGQRD